MSSHDELLELEKRIRELCKRAIADCEERTTINKEAVQTLEVVNKMIGVFAERDAKRPQVNPYQGMTNEELEEALRQ